MKFQTALSTIKEIQMLASSAEEEMCENENDVDEIMDNLFKDLKVLDKNNGWIPVSERLPEFEKEVLVTDGIYISICSLNYYERYEAKLCIDKYGYLTPIDKIKAWMPLPEPYKGA